MNTKDFSHPELSDSAFDLRMRAEMALAFEPGPVPAHLLRKPARKLQRRGIVRAMLGLAVLSTGAGTVLAMRPPALVRNAIEHDAHERTLRGSTTDPRQLIAHLGLEKAKALPGFPQLMRVCDIDGHAAYHLVTYFEKGGMVTVFAFDPSMKLLDGSGWWNSVYWKTARNRHGTPLIFLAQSDRGIKVAEVELQIAAASQPG